MLLGIVAFALVLVVTDPPGPGLDPDALSYLGAAESLVAHGEYRIPTAPWASPDSTAPLAHFPPGYPTALAVPVALGMSPPQGARLVEALAAGVTISTLVLLIGAATTTIAGVLLAVALLVTPAMAEVHLSVLSEPLFLACLALTLAGMVAAPDRPLRAGLPAALAAIVRYAGASLVGAVALWQLGRPGPLRLRLRRAAVAVTPAVLLQGIWVLRTHHVGASAAIRQFAVYGDLAFTLRQGNETLRDWIIPVVDPSSSDVPHRGAIALVAGLLLIVLTISAARRARGLALARRASDRPPPSPVDAWRLLRASALLLLCYLGMVAASRLLADPNIPLDDRLLSPALLLATVILATTIALWWRGPHPAPPRLALAVALAAWGIASASVTLDEARGALDYGSDFAGDQWRHSALLDWARTDGAPHPLYTNWPAAVYFHLHRPSRELPGDDDLDGLAAFADTLRRRNGRILAFDVAAKATISNAALLAQPGLRVVARLADGVVLAPTP
jgi:hypothetical protein